MASSKQSQFSLRILLGITVFAAVLFGLFRWVDTFWAAVLAWVLILLAAHITATHLGNRTLRRERFPRKSNSNISDPTSSPTALWEEPTSTKKIKQAVSSAAAGMGGCGGCVLIFCQNSQNVSIPGVCVAGISTAVLLGLLTFGLSNVLEISWKLLSQFPD